MKTKAFILGLLFPTMAFAHGGHGDLAGFTSGFMHTLSGLDHLLALLVGGVWLSRLKLENRMYCLAGFALVTVLAVIAGSYISAWQFDWSLVATIVVMSVFMAFTRRWFSAWGIALMACAFFLHGLAHGSEVLLNSHSWPAVVGVILSGLVVLFCSAYVALFVKTIVTNIFKVKA